MPKTGVNTFVQLLVITRSLLELESSQFFCSSDSAYDVKNQIKQEWKDKPVTVLVPMLCDWLTTSASAYNSNNL